MNFKLTILLLLFLPFWAISQDQVTFLSTDGLKISAYSYEVNKDDPYILFFHQAGSSRGEYKETARKFLKLGYNCLVVDLRSGGEMNFVNNETAARAKKEGKPTTYIEAEKDILAAIEYAYGRSPKPVVLVGSSYSASLCLILAKNNTKVKAVVAFSPGEFLSPDYVLKDELIGFNLPVFVACAQRELSFVEELFSSLTTGKTICSPKNGPGDHGAKAIWNSCPESREYWLALNVFFKSI